ncbi:Apoptotic chromatin condensation inducer in the nucleus [Acropora cervicornis]|uniref:Apoptotic chromatin condensation inducer in the nucleus n=1 Tax=Acropora cervicornis TaxID=6130 RepID=A0AAD9QE29_ACRCE|nr:Apoptotic chromatin condensation inducer in the nucleus [Acropora cervicornis]
MARDTEGLLGKAKEMETEVKTEKPSKKEQTVEKAPEDVVKEEDDQRNAGNLLDNLFRKTKTTPCLYWLPLSDEQSDI